DDGLVEENIKNQQLVVLQEREQGYDEPHGRDWDALGDVSFSKEHPYHHSVIGTVADIEAFEIGKVRDFWAAHYRPSNAVLGLVGHFDSEEMLDRIEFWFSDLPDVGPAKPRITEQPQLPRPKAAGYIEDNVEDLTLYLAYPTVPLGHDDEPALELLSYVLSYGRDTRLDDRLYFDTNLATDEGAFHYASDLDGSFLFYATSPKTPLKKLDSVIKGVLEDTVKDPPNADELKRAVQGVKTSMLDQLENPVDRAEMLVDCQRLKGNANCQVDDFARYEAVTTADLVRVTQTYLLTDQLATLSVVPRGSARKALPDSVEVVLK
ncbi:MAG: insulinase family protein, partial [Proteobacteria bacterium]|nr:insulinase family protein [Pseudomonadota bacterium]